VPAERWPQLVETPEVLPDTVPQAIAEPVMACLARNPADRPAPGHVADQLEQVLEDLPKPRMSRLKPRLGR